MEKKRQKRNDKEMETPPSTRNAGCSTCSNSHVAFWIWMSVFIIIFLVGIALMLYYLLKPKTETTSENATNQFSSFASTRSIENPIVTLSTWNSPFPKETVIHYPSEVCMPYQACFSAVPPARYADSLQVAFDNYRTRWSTTFVEPFQQ